VSIPTVKGLPRFAHVTRKFATRKLPDYVLQTIASHDESPQGAGFYNDPREGS